MESDKKLRGILDLARLLHFPAKQHISSLTEVNGISQKITLRFVRIVRLRDTIPSSVARPWRTGDIHDLRAAIDKLFPKAVEATLSS